MRMAVKSPPQISASAHPAGECERTDEARPAADRPRDGPDARDEPDVRGAVEDRHGITGEVVERTVEYHPCRGRHEEDGTPLRPTRPRRDQGEPAHAPIIGMTDHRRILRGAPDRATASPTSWLQCGASHADWYP